MVHNMSAADGLLLYLSLYAGQRFPVVNGTQQVAFERWSVALGDTEAAVVEILAPTVQEIANSFSPRDLFRAAAGACDADASEAWAGQGDVFCAALVSHNVIRALGRRPTYIDQTTGVSYGLLL
jgi:hypothetical protein